MLSLNVQEPDQILLIKALLAMPNVVSIEKYDSKSHLVVVEFPTLKNTELLDLYLQTNIERCDAENWLKKIAPNCIVNGDQSQIINYDDMSNGEIFERLKNEDFLKFVADWDLMMS